MKAASAVSTYTVDFNETSPGRATRPTTGRIPRVTRMLALAHKIDGMILDGELKDLADAARVIGVTRARMTQITNLMLLAPDIQEAILNLPPARRRRDSVSERSLRTIVAEPNWDVQRRLWDEAKP